MGCDVSRRPASEQFNDLLRPIRLGCFSKRKKAFEFEPPHIHANHAMFTHLLPGKVC